MLKTNHVKIILSLYDATTLQQTYEQSFDAPVLSFVEGLGRARNPTDWTFSPPFEGGAGWSKTEWLIRDSFVVTQATSIAKNLV